MPMYQTDAKMCVCVSVSRNSNANNESISSHVRWNRCASWLLARSSRFAPISSQQVGVLHLSCRLHRLKKMFFFACYQLLIVSRLCLRRCFSLIVELFSSAGVVVVVVVVNTSLVNCLFQCSALSVVLDAFDSEPFAAPSELLSLTLSWLSPDEAFVRSDWLESALVAVSSVSTALATTVGVSRSCK